MRYSSKEIKRALLKYDTKEFIVEIDQNLELKIVGSVDAYALLDRLIEKEENCHNVTRFPYWAEVWPASLGMSKWFKEHNLAPCQALELGCGLGLVGITLTRLGWIVQATDYVEDALIFSAYNAERNGIVLNYNVSYLDWRHPVGSSYDCLIGSDIAYERNNHPYLNKVLSSLLKPGGRFYLSDPQRPVVRSFISGLKDRGYAHQQDGLSVRWQKLEHHIDIHTFEKPF